MSGRITGFTLLAVLLCASTAFASKPSTWVSLRAKKGTPVIQGQWHADFTTVKNYATKNGYPFVAVWSNGKNCSHCLTLEGCFISTTFKDWMKTSGVVYWFGYVGDSSSEDRNGGTGYNFCYNGQNFYPLVRVYWKDSKGKVVTDWTGMGDQVDGGLGGSSGAKKVISFLKKKFNGWDFDQKPVSSYTGGEFGVGDSAYDRLEAENGVTESVLVPLTRTNATAKASASTNYFVSVSGKKATTNRIDWVENQAEASVTVETPSVNAPSSQITLYLLDAEKKAVATNHITYVEEKENSAANPYWLKEKTAATLPWGKWTADFAMATNRAKAGKATLVLVSGSKWCPDCVKTDKNFLDQGAVKTWLNGAKVACAVVDVPKVGQTNPSILTYQSCVVSETYSTALCGDPQKARVQSGAEYLSRHNVKADDAARMTSLYADLFNKSTEEGGLCRPECVDVKNLKTGKFKTGIPALIVMRPQGTVAGRIYQFNNESPSSYSAAYLQRLQELVDQVDDADEEDNDTASTTKAVLKLKDRVEGKTLSAVDQADYYRIPADAKDNVMNFRLESADKAEVVFSIVNLAKTAEQVLTSAEGTLGEGSPLDVSFEIPSETCFLKISYKTNEDGYAPTGSYFDFLNTGDSRCTYTLTSDPLFVPTTTEATYERTKVGETVKMRITKDETYRLVGIDTQTDEFKSKLDPGVSADLYVAKESTTVELVLTAPQFIYRLWNAGKVSFAKAADSIAENGVRYTIVLNREEGAAGQAQVTLWLTNTNAYADQYKLDFENGKKFTWADTESEPKTATVTVYDNDFCDGDRYLNFRIVKGESDAGVGTGDFVLTIRDLDKSIPGKLAIEAVNPALSKAGTVVARAESKISIDVCREGGTSGDVSGRLSASAGVGLDVDNFIWPSRNADKKAVEVTLPKLTKTVKSAKLTLTGTNGTKVDSSKRYLTIKLVAANAPGFTVAATNFPTFYRYTDIGAFEIAVDGEHVTDWSKIKIAKASGSLPSGVKAAFSKTGVTFTGVPAKAGSFTAVYQVSEGSVAGLTVRVSMTVLDPVTYKEIGSAVPLNASVKSSRTIADIQVLGHGTAEYAFVTSLVGLVDLTIPRTGKLSAKFRSPLDGLTLSYSSKSWKEVAADGTLIAKLVCTKRGYDRAFTVRAEADGQVKVADFEIADEHFHYEVSCRVPNERTDAAKPATYTDYKGLYTVSLPLARDPEGPEGFAMWGDPQSTGDGYVALKMTSASAVKVGKVTYAGMLPNGATFSGSTTLQPAEWDETLQYVDNKWSKVKLPLMTISAADILDGILELDRFNAVNYGSRNRRTVFDSQDVLLRWYHNEVKPYEEKVEEDEAPVGSCDALLEAWGGKYDPSENLMNCCLTAFGGSSLSFFAIALPVGDYTDYGEVQPWDPSKYGVIVGYDSKKKRSTLKVQKNPAKGFTLSFNAETGIVSGEFRMPTKEDDETVGYIPMSYRGVVMPGWGAAGCTDCGTGDPIAQNRPFISGTAWCKDHLIYTDCNDRDHSIKVKRGCAFSVGKEPGK